MTILLRVGISEWGADYFPDVKHFGNRVDQNGKFAAQRPASTEVKEGVIEKISMSKSSTGKGNIELVGAEK